MSYLTITAIDEMDEVKVIFDCVDTSILHVKAVQLEGWECNQVEQDKAKQADLIQAWLTDKGNQDFALYTLVDFVINK